MNSPRAYALKGAPALRSGAAVLLLSLSLLAAVAPGSARADDSDDSGSGALFGSVLKKAASHVAGGAVDVLGQKAHLNSGQIEGIKKTGAAFRKSAEQITEKEEYFIGRAVSAQILSRYKPYENETVNRYVQALTQAVALSSDRPEIGHGYHAQVLDSEELNAMSAPGGFIFVTTGLIKACRSEDELAAVLAHELAHVARKHGLKTIKAARLTEAFTLLGQQAVAAKYSDKDLGKLTDLFSGSVDDVAKTVVTTGYGRDNEYEADRVGDQFLQRAGYDPAALSAFIESSDASGKKGGLLKTHPPAKKRVAELSKSPLAPSADYVDSAARKRRFAAVLAKL